MRVALLVAVAACDWSLHRMQEQPRCTTHAATDQLAGGACDLVAPDGIVAWREPAPAAAAPTRAQVQRGRDRFDRFCAPCHGITGDGDSDVARAMTLRRPPSLVDATVRGFSDARIAFAIARGYGVMPSYAFVPAADRAAIVMYVRALQARDVRLDELAPAEREEARRWLR